MLKVAVASIAIAVSCAAATAVAYAQDVSFTALTGQQCAAERFGNTLKCTSNDFVATSIFLRAPGGDTPPTCVFGETFFADIRTTIQSNSPTRYDVALFVGEDGQSPQVNDPTRTCSLGVMPPIDGSAAVPPHGLRDLDTDACGDFASGGTASLDISDVLVKCVPFPGTNAVRLPYLLVFANNSNGATCTAANVQPSTTAKCVATTSATIADMVVEGWVEITKQTVPDGDPANFAFSASASNGTSSLAVTPSSASLSDGQTQRFTVPLDSLDSAITMTLTEAQLGGWEPTASISCTDPEGGAASYATVDETNRTITVSLAGGTANYAARCTVTNTKIPDRSDAPTSGLAPDGFSINAYGEAAHRLVDGIHLGPLIDADSTSLASPDADGDDGDGLADEDGLSIPVLTSGATVTIDTQVAGSGGLLSGWIDWNGNGAFDAGEQVAADLADDGSNPDAVAGDGTLQFEVNIPSGGVSQTFARFRWSTVAGLGATGIADDGEVEDYVVTVSLPGATLSGKVFFDNGAGGGIAYDAVQQAGEAAAERASVTATDSGGVILASGISGSDGTWSLTLPASISGSVTITVEPYADRIVVSESTSGLPGLVNPDLRDGAFTFIPATGSEYNDLDFGLIDGPDLESDRSEAITPGGIAELSHVYRASASADVTFSLVDIISNPAEGFVTTLFRDTGCDGSPDAVLSGAVAVTADDTICIIARTQASGGIGAGAQLTYGLTAQTSLTGISRVMTLRNDDILTVPGGSAIRIRKFVTNSTAGSPETTSNTGASGDTLVYRIEITNPSSEPAVDITVNDATPAWTKLKDAVPSPVMISSTVSCEVTTPSAGGGAGYVGPIEWFCPGSFAPGSEGFVFFRVEIE